MKAQYVKKNTFFFKINKTSSASIAWKNILDHRYLLRKGLMWVLGNDQSINFLYDNWNDESPLIHNINANMEYLIEKKTKLAILVTPTTQWDTKPLINILPDHIIKEIKAIPIPITYLNDRIMWRCTPYGGYSVKTATWGK